MDILQHCIDRCEEISPWLRVHMNPIVTQRRNKERFWSTQGKASVENREGGILFQEWDKRIHSRNSCHSMPVDCIVTAKLVPVRVVFRMNTAWSRTHLIHYRSHRNGETMHQSRAISHCKWLKFSCLGDVTCRPSLHSVLLGRVSRSWIRLERIGGK